MVTNRMSGNEQVKYIVAVNYGLHNEVFEFTSRQAADEFCRLIPADIQYARTVQRSTHR